MADQANSPTGKTTGQETAPQTAQVAQANLLQQTLLAGLYVVATPLGNLEDITLRALAVLRSAALIAAEDTRTSATLLRHYGVSAPTLAAHESSHSETLPLMSYRPL